MSLVVVVPIMFLAGAITSGVHFTLENLILNWSAAYGLVQIAYSKLRQGGETIEPE